MTYRHMNSLWDLVWTKTCFVVVVVVFPSHSLFPGDQIIIQANSVFINPSPLSLILPESKLPASYPNPNFEFSPTSETEATVLNRSLCWSVHWHFVRTQSIIFLSKFYSLLYKRDCFVSLMQNIGQCPLWFLTCVCLCVCAQSLSVCVLWEPMNCSSLGFSDHGIFQARILERVASPYSRWSSQPRDQIHVSCVCCISRQILHHCTTWEAQFKQLRIPYLYLK